MASVVLLIPYTENLSVSLYGEFAIYISFALLVQILMNFGIDTYLSVHYYDHKDDPAQLKKFLAEITGAIFIIGIVLTLLFLIAGDFLFSLVFQNESGSSHISFFPYGLMSVVTAFFNAFYRTYVNLQVFGDKAIKYFWFAVFNFVVTVLISVIGIYVYPQTLIGPMWGRFLSGVLIFALSFYYVMKEFGVQFNTSVFPALRNYCLPVFIFSLLTWVLGYINNFILNHFASTADVGVYDFALKCTTIVEFAALGLLSSVNPQVYQIWKNKKLKESSKEENRYHHVFSMANMLIIALNILLLPFVIHLFVKNEGFYESIKYLPVLLVSFIFRGTFNLLMNPIYYFKKTNVLPRIFSISALIQIGSGILLVNYFGIWGAVWSYFLVKPIQLIFVWMESRKYFTFRFNSIKIIVMPLLYCIAVIFLFQFTSYSLLIKNIAQMVFAVLLIFIVYRNEIKEVPGMLKRKP